MSPRRPTPWTDTAGSAETHRILRWIIGGAVIFAVGFGGALHWRAVAEWLAG